MDTTLFGRKSEVQYLVDQVLGSAQVLMLGPVGIGKTAILNEVASKVRAVGCPCGFSSHTGSLGEVTQALARVLSGVEAPNQRKLRNRLQMSTELQPAVILLDHVTAATAAMKGYLKKLHGQVGVVFAVDAEHPRDYADARSLNLAYREMKLSPLRKNYMRTILLEALDKAGLPFQINDEDRDKLIVAARGRPGWLFMFADRLKDTGYWNEGRVSLHLLEVDAARQIAGCYMKNN